MKLRELKCNNCGAKLNIKEKDKIVKCEFCNSTYSIEDNDKMEVISNEEFSRRFKETVLKQRKIFSVISIVFCIIFVSIFLFAGAMITKTILSFNTHSYNDFFIESYNGTQIGEGVISLIDNITGEMAKNDRKITVVYFDKEYTDVDDIRAIKKEINSFKEYEVILHYNNKKVIDKVTITE